MDLTKILEAVITLVITIISVVVIPYIKSKLDAEKINDLKMWVKIGVQAAEMIFKESGKGAEKKAYVLDFLNEKGFYIDTESLENLIESAVLELKMEL